MKICGEEGCKAIIDLKKKFCPDCAHERKNKSSIRSQARRHNRGYLESRERSYGMTNKTEYFTEERKKKLKEDGSYIQRENYCDAF